MGRETQEFENDQFRNQKDLGPFFQTTTHQFVPGTIPHRLLRREVEDVNFRLPLPFPAMHLAKPCQSP